MNNKNHKQYCNARDWECPYCHLIIKSRRALYNHFKVCDEKRKLPTDSLGRVISDKVLDGYKRRDSANHYLIENGLYNYSRHPHTECTKKYLSAKRQEWLESHPNHGVNWYDVNGIKVQGTWERQFAEYLNSKQIRWDRRKIPYCVSHNYTPDFFCIDQSIYFEVKGFLRDRDLFKMYLVLNEHPDIQIKLIMKEELSHLHEIDIFSLPNFNEIYKFEDIDRSKFVDVWHCDL